MSDVIFRGLVYKYTNVLNGKSYIGITLHSREGNRKNEHKSRKDRTSHFSKAIAKYGMSSFQYEVLERDIDSPEKLRDREIYWIEYFNSYKCGYNSTTGGQGTFGYIPTEESRRKIREAWAKLIESGYKRAPLSDEMRKWMSESKKGIRPTESALAAVRQAALRRIGTERSEETKERMKNSCHNKRCVVNMRTGRIYDSIMQVCEIHTDFNYGGLKWSLRGNKKYKGYDFRFLENSYQ